jgi:hypothetical protein
MMTGNDPYFRIEPLQLLSWYQARVILKRASRKLAIRKVKVLSPEKNIGKWKVEDDNAMMNIFLVARQCTCFLLGDGILRYGR